MWFKTKTLASKKCFTGWIKVQQDLKNLANLKYFTEYTRIKQNEELDIYRKYNYK